MQISRNINQQFLNNVSIYNVAVVREILTKYKDRIDIHCSHNTAISRLFKDCSFYRDHNESNAEFLKIKELIHLLVQHGAKIDSSIIQSAIYNDIEEDGTYLPLKLLFELGIDLDAIFYNKNEKLDCLSYAFSITSFQTKLKLQKKTQIIRFLLLHGSRVTLTKAYLTTEEDSFYGGGVRRELKDMAIHWELLMLLFCLEKKNCYFIWL